MSVSQDSVTRILEEVLKQEPDAEMAFCILLLASVAIGRDVGGLDKRTFLENASSAWGAAPVGLVEKGSGVEPEKGTLN